MNTYTEVYGRENEKPNDHNGNVAGETDNELSQEKILELAKLNGFQTSSTQSLFGVVSKILDESIERKNGDIPHGTGFLLKKVVQEIEQRVLSQAASFKKQNVHYKVLEEKYQSRMKVLETLANGTSVENEVVMLQLQKTKIEKDEIELKKKLEEKEVYKLMQEKDRNAAEMLALKQELESVRNNYESHCLKLETRLKETKEGLENKVMALECLLTDSKNKVKELEAFTESKSLRWKRREYSYKNFLDSHLGVVQGLRTASESIKREVMKTQKIYSEEFYNLGMNLQGLTEAAESYHTVLAENRKLYNEVQDLKGNIRVYCRIRPFLPGQSRKQTTIEYMGENGELVVANPLKPGKESHRLFKFNKVFHPDTTQEEVFLDTQPLIRSVLDGYNVCIFAYGQTGSGKTYTMTGPSISSRVDWGVNYRALNDLFNISQSRRNSFTYEVCVQMVEIYNEQVRDLLSSDTSQKRLGIWNTALPNGLAVPDASILPVNSTSDVLELMNIGLMNRAVGATALNERSSRSHSVLTVHVRGTDLKSGDSSRGSLHLVDLAGSERVDRSEATGDRLREAQHINKSLSALGDVIFALAQKSSHVPYRNSKLTQVLQGSLGGQAKTLMFVQLNPDVESYSETISTLKFAERVSGVELGAARSNKEGRGVRELMEQVNALKDTVAKKDEEIVKLRLLKSSISSSLNGSASPRRHSAGTSPQSRTPPPGRKSLSPRLIPKAASDLENSSEYSDKNSEAGSSDEFRRRQPPKEFLRRSSSSSSKLAATTQGSKKVVSSSVESNVEDIELLGIGEAEERLSDISDGELSMGTETDGSINSIVEFTLFPESAKPTAAAAADSSSIDSRLSLPAKIPRPPSKQLQKASSLSSSVTRISSKLSSSSKKTNAGSSSATKNIKRRN